MQSLSQSDERGHWRQIATDSKGAIATADMERGMGGRLESAFESAKEKREATFVAFMTAGYPKAEGTFVYFAQNIRVDRISRL